MFVFWSLYCLSSCYVCLLVIVLSVLLIVLSFGHCIVCPPVIFIFWSLYFLTNITGGQKIQWPKDKNNRRTDNTMIKRQTYQEDRKYNDQKTNITGGQTIQWPKDKNNRRTDNTMSKRQTYQEYFLSSCYVCLLVIVLSVLLIVLSFGHCIVCPPVIFVFWSLYCLSSCYVCLLVIVLWRTRKYNDQKTKISGGETIQWPKDKNIRRTANTMTKRQK
jgi:fatty acid desaturase